MASLRYSIMASQTDVKPKTDAGLPTVSLRPQPSGAMNGPERLGGAKLISHLSSPTDRPDLPAGADSDSGSPDRPTLRRAQRGEAKGSEIVGDRDLCEV